MRKNYRRHTEEEKQFIIENKNKPDKWIAKKLNITTQRISDFRKKYKIKRDFLSYRKLIAFKETSNGCFEVISHKPNELGYPTFQRNGKRTGLHRHIYEECFGFIPDGMVIMHTCDNRICINPEHLKLGTHADNSKDCHEKGRNARGRMYPRTKLFKRDISKIRKDNRTLKEIAKDYEVIPETIHAVKKHRSWKWVK